MSESKIALITGASRGIGRAIAVKFANLGYQVVGTATSDSGAERIQDYLSQFNGMGAVLNVTHDIKQIQLLFDKIKTECGGFPDVLINNAGIRADGLLLRMTEEQWLSVINTNLNSVFKLSKLALKPMIKKRWGRIVTIGSVVGQMGNPGQANYAASKAGVEGFSRAMALEVAARGVTVNVVSPGFIDTDMTQSMSDDQKENILGAIPMKRMGLTSEVAELVSFLASDGAAYLSGQNVHINGGLFMN